MCDNRDKSGVLLTGIVLGAAVGAGLTFLFGTKKGKEIREKVRDQYPEFFEKVDNVLDDLGDKYEDVVDEVRKVEEEVAKSSEGGREAVKTKVADLGKAVEHLGKQLETVTPKKHIFFKAGKPLRK